MQARKEKVPENGREMMLPQRWGNTNGPPPIKHKAQEKTEDGQGDALIKRKEA